MYTDEELMQDVAKGDIKAFGEIVRRNQRYAWNTAWRLLQDPAEAEDAAQDAFLKILDAAPRYRPTAAFRTYLCRVVTRLCLDRLEKKKPLYTDAPPVSTSSRPDPSDELAARDRASVVQRALQTLPPRQRTALVLQYFEDLSYKEIAEAMGVSVKSVERLLARGRDALADRLEEWRQR